MRSPVRSRTTTRSFAKGSGLTPRSPRIRVIGEAIDGASAVALTEPKARRRDHGSPHARHGRAGGDRGHRRESAGHQVLIFTAYGEKSLLQRGLESGARGYILKETPHETLIRAIEKVASGETFVDPGPHGRVRGRQGHGRHPAAARARDPPAARRRHVERGSRTSSSSAETVKSHVRHILAKLEADTRTQAVVIALREAMID